MRSMKMFVEKYASTPAFQIPVRIGSINAYALIHTGAQCLVLSSGLVKHAFDKQSLQSPICRRIEVAEGAIITAHGLVVITIESAFGEHMIKFIILKDNNND
uniref:Uncharacterized protein n=1 Tax=Romanomermis culicivorax TaxID=13658 RepID=A0A915K0S7_ROMCU